jgi:Flp pilus assembly protein TadG
MKTYLPSKTLLNRLSKGQSLVEFAMAATLMIFLLLATIDFGLAFFSWIALRDAAQEGATFGSLFPPTSYSDTDLDDIRTRVKNATKTPINMGALPNGNIVVDVLDATTGNRIDPLLPTSPCPGNGIRVTVTYNYQVITPMISTFIGRSYIPISASVADTILVANTAPATTCP